MSRQNLSNSKKSSLLEEKSALINGRFMNPWFKLLSPRKSLRRIQKVLQIESSLAGLEDRNTQTKPQSK